MSENVYLSRGDEISTLIIILYIWGQDCNDGYDMKASWNDGWYHDRLLVDQLRIWQNGGARTGYSEDGWSEHGYSDFEIGFSKQWL